jgi:putative oxidoreductase
MTVPKSTGAPFDAALLLVRLVIGASMAAFHGWGKITGGPELWARIGDAMGHLGIHFAPVFWGFMAAFAEFGGSILFAAGFLFRPAALLLAFNMLVAAMSHLARPAGERGAGWEGASHALELFAVYVAMLLLGPGKLALRPRRG